MTKKSEGQPRNLSRTCSVRRLPEVEYNLDHASSTHNWSNKMPMMPLLRILDRITLTLKSDVTRNSSEHTTCQRNGPLACMREVLWIPWVPFVKFNLTSVNFLVCEMKMTMTYKYQLLLRLLWNMSCTRGWADAFTGIVHYHQNRVFRYQSWLRFQTLMGEESEDKWDWRAVRVSGSFPVVSRNASPIKP
jgi:hypothetical protein